MNRILKDLQGKRHGLLVAEKPIGVNKYFRTLWICKCDCGNNITTAAFNQIKSCGCLLHDKKPKSETPINYLLARYEISADKRKLCFLLTRQEFVENAVA